MKNAAAPSATVRELVLAAQSGTDAAGPALDQLLSDHEGLCRQVVIKIRGRGLDDDLLQTARLAFIAAVRTYRPAVGATLATYAWKAIYRAVLKDIRTQQRRADRLQTVPLTDDAPAQKFGDDDLVARLQRMVLRSALMAMPRDDRALLKRLYWEDYSQHEVAAKYGVSQAAIYKRHRRIVGDLRLAIGA